MPGPKEEDAGGTGKAERQLFTLIPAFSPSLKVGDLPVSSPAPVIPNHLRDQKLKTSVVIEFLITAQGQVTPRLLDSSGNDELDVIAFKTDSLWKFKPAAQDNVPIDPKTRLRILFEVY